MVLGDPEPMADTQREAAKGEKVRILHEGRPDVQRAVPIISKAPRETETEQTFTSRLTEPGSKQEPTH